MSAQTGKDAMTESVLCRIGRKFLPEPPAEGQLRKLGTVFPLQNSKVEWQSLILGGTAEDFFRPF